MNIETLFDIGQKVTIDGDRSIVGTVTGFMANGGGAIRRQFEVSWFNNGSAASAWFDEFRLTEVAQ